MAAATTVPVRPETLRRLKAYKVGDATYDEVLTELMEEVPPPGSGESTTEGCTRNRASRWPRCGGVSRSDQ